MFPTEFEQAVTRFTDELQAKRLLEALDGEPITSIRFNPFKLKEKPQGDAVPWSHYGFYLAQRPVFTLDPLMHGGVYYVQEASSMFVEHIYRQAVGDAEGVKLLDLCAAPGGKTTLYSSLVGADGLIVANDNVKQRASILADNVCRWGVGNVMVSCNDAARFSEYKHWFDVLAVDAPCSGEGMFRKNKNARSEWSTANVDLCAARQKRILADAWDTLRPGGVLIYSTCTFNPKENEDNVVWLTENYAVEAVDIEVPKEWGVQQGEAAGIALFRLLPSEVRGEGFFVAVMRKADGKLKRETPKAKKEPITWLNRNENRPLTDWVNQPEYMKFAKIGNNCYAHYRSQHQAITALSENLNIIYSGVCMGQLFNDKLRPDHALALFHDMHPAKATCTQLTLDQTLNYLRKQEFKDISIIAEGLNLLNYEGLPIGWVKRIGHRANTLLPNSFRIVNL